MAIYYLNAQIIGRSAGRTATGAAAYRAGERIVDERTGLVFDYTRRKGDIEAEIHAPQGAPTWATDRAELWNQAEKAERRGDAQIAREIVVAFPKELDPDQQRELIRGYVQEQFVARGMVADVAIHRNPGNPHAHIMLTMREIGPEGFSAKKNRDWNRPETLERWREEWATHSNRALERAGHDERIDHRSHAEQGLERLPQVHLGPHAHALEQRGIPTDKGDHNRAVSEHNAVVIDLQKAREEKRALEAEKTAQARYERRVEDGWFSGHAQALARLEAGAGGAELSQKPVEERYFSVDKSLQAVKDQISFLNLETNTLREARTALDVLQGAQERLKRLDTVSAALWRVVSPKARDAYRHAEGQVHEASRNVDRWGLTTNEQWERRQADLQQQETRRPELERKVEGLTATRSVLSQALQGFEKQVERKTQVKEREERSRLEERARQWEERARAQERRSRDGYDRGR